MSGQEAMADVRIPLEKGLAAEDSRGFRRCLGQYPTGVTVITACHEGQLLGMAVNSFASVSLDPPLVLWSLRRESRSAEAFCAATHMAINVLAVEQVQVSQWFGAAHPQRFELAPWQPDEHGSPLLEGAIAHLQCRREALLDGGDHVIVVLRVEHFARYAGAPLVFSQGQYAVTGSHPHLATQDAQTAEGVSEAGEVSFMRLLSVAFQRSSAQFDTERRLLGVTAHTTRILSHLVHGPCDARELEAATYLGPRALEDAVTELVRSGDIQALSDGRYALTEAGWQKVQRTAQRSQAFSQEKLKGLPAADIAAARRVLQALHAR
jgi:flavin reductase (DIM6/NTAB) family NADH-FMN oxidoreductase RutF